MGLEWFAGEFVRMIRIPSPWLTIC